MKPLQLSFFIVFIFLQSSLLAQCPTGEVYLENQQDIADFIADFPNCTELSTLEISDDVTDISGLSNLTKIDYLYLQRCPMLTNLEGLQNIDSITGNFGLTGEVGFSDLCGLSNLSFIGQDLRIEETSNLKSLEGLNRVVYIEDDITITDNQDLGDIFGLENVLALGMEADGSHRLEIRNNPLLSNCCGVLDLINNVEALNIDITNNSEGCQNESELLNADCDFDYNPCGIIDDVLDLGVSYAVYPNPVSGHIFVKDNEGNNVGVSTVEIYDLDGRLIRISKDTNDGVDVGNLMSGLYIIKVMILDEYFVKRVYVK